MKKPDASRLLPAFPRTPHLPHQPNIGVDDVVAANSEASVIFTQKVSIDEKVDGSSIGVCFAEENPLVRNRDRFVRKGKYAKTPSKKQFAPLWNYVYEHQKRFRQLEEQGLSVYGEWMWMRHGIFYDRLPDWFIAYDLYDHRTTKFLPNDEAREILEGLDFALPQRLFVGELDDYEHLKEIMNQRSAWSDENMEGVYVRTGQSEVTHRFKMVRPDFVAGALWDSDQVLKNSLA